MNEERYYPGKGCQCYAHSESECACNVDWTDPEVYELRGEVKELKKWKEAIEEQLEITGLDTIEYKDPKEALYHLVHYQMEGAYNDGLKASEWKEAVLEELMSWHIYKHEYEKDPRKALHALAVLHSDVAVDLYKRDRWYRRAWDKIRDIWYSTPISYKLWKICGSKQPPF